VIFPLKFPLRTNDPVCDPPEVKQAVEVVKLRFVPVTITEPPLCVKDVVNPRAGVLSVFVSVAVQLPVTVGELLELPPPHATSIKPTARTVAIPNCFTGLLLVCLLEPLAITKVVPARQRPRRTDRVGVSLAQQQQRPAAELGVSYHHLIAVR
jgi:hypothetical protein